MEPSTAEQNPDPPKARVSITQTAPLTPQEASAAPEEGQVPKPRVKRKRTTMGLIATGIFILLLLALSTWWFISRDNGAMTSQGLPKETIALINSSTPVALQLPAAARDSAGVIEIAPDAEGRSPALQEADLALEEGRYDAAISQYSALVAAGTQSEARDALWGLADTYSRSGQNDLAIRAYSIFAGLSDPRAVRALYKLGQLYEANGQDSDALRLYQEYASRGGPSANAVNLLAARLMGNAAGAEAIYKAIVDSNPQDADLRDALSGWAVVKSARGDHLGAAKLYDQLAAERKAHPRPLRDKAGKPPEALAAEEEAAANKLDDAKKRLLDFIKAQCKDAPRCSTASYSYAPYSALESLLKIEPSAVVSGSVAPMLAGNIAYNAGYAAQAIAFLNPLRAASSSSPDSSAAYFLTGKAYEMSGDAASAYNWYTTTVQTYPAAPEAPEAQRRAAGALSDQSEWGASIGAYDQMLSSYPTAQPQITLARIEGAILAYRLAESDKALQFLGPLLTTAPVSPTLAAEADFWGGKINKARGASDWKGALSKVSALDPASFFDFRARSISAGEPDGGPTVPTFKASGVSAAALGVDYNSEAAGRAEMLAWASTLTATRGITATGATPAARATAQPSPSSPPSGLNPYLSGDPEMQRAVALLNLGYSSEAYISFRALAERLRSSGDAADLAGLTLYLRYHADTRTAMRVAESLLAMWSGNPLKVPKLLLTTLYPTPYSGLVMAQSSTRDIDPLLVYALMRQESEFVPGARSSADALGLTQVVPSTGQGIADQLGDAAFSPDKLYLPYVSIRYGIYYLASNLPQFDRKLLPTLAAYNAGPGNAARWLSGSALIDPDLYIERVDLFETGDYLQRVYRNYGFYKQVYAP
ncbi:MAG: transglycosylase SLT domain-containing protein [Chloroflexi bacterium]|nr:transglycosylase SLT domain-containing protein [Chloroflexota bacterium]